MIIGLMIAMSNMFLNINNSDTIIVLTSKVLDCIQQYSVFLIEFENLIISDVWLLICWWQFSFLQR